LKATRLGGAWILRKYKQLANLVVHLEMTPVNRESAKNESLNGAREFEN
jgi:hypothetical protein